MEKISINGIVDIEKKQRVFRAILWFVLAMILFITLVTTISDGKLYGLVITIPLVYCIEAMRKNLRKKDSRRTILTIISDENGLRVNMPGTIRKKGTYTEKEMFMPSGSVDGLYIDENLKAIIKARNIECYEVESDITSNKRTITQEEIVFRTDKIEMEKCIKYFESIGISVYQLPNSTNN